MGPRLKHPALCSAVIIAALLFPLLAFFGSLFLACFLPNKWGLALIFISFAAMPLEVWQLLKSGGDSDLALIRINMLGFYSRARQWYPLPPSFSAEALQEKLARIGENSEPAAATPRPDLLRYRSESSGFVDASGIETVVAWYHADELDERLYLQMKSAAKFNAKKLEGKKHYRILDRQQKKAPLNRCTVMIVCAARVEEAFRQELYKTACKGIGDEFDHAFLGCVLDLEQKICTFDSLRVPHIVLAGTVPAKNRGITLIESCVFDHHLPLDTAAERPEKPAWIKDLDPEMTLWEFLRAQKQELGLFETENQKRFKKMQHGEVALVDDLLFIKWHERGTLTAVEPDDTLGRVTVAPLLYWDFPKANQISKKDLQALRNRIALFYAERGYVCEFQSDSDEEAG